MSSTTLSAAFWTISFTLVIVFLTVFSFNFRLLSTRLFFAAWICHHHLLLYRVRDAPFERGRVYVGGVHGRPAYLLRFPLEHGGLHLEQLNKPFPKSDTMFTRAQKSITWGAMLRGYKCLILNLRGPFGGLDESRHVGAPMCAASSVPRRAMWKFVFGTLKFGICLILTVAIKYCAFRIANIHT